MDFYEKEFITSFFSFLGQFYVPPTCGVIQPNVLDHFHAWVEGNITLILKLEKNSYKKFMILAFFLLYRTIS